MKYAYLASFVEMLQALFSDVFNTVFAPILKDLLTIIANFVINIVWNILAELLLSLFIMLCSLLDLLESVFNIFSGISTVEVSGKKTYLLDAFFQMEEVSRVFTYITVMAVIICFIFTIYKTAKSISDMALEDKNPVSKVLSDGMKAAFTFMVIPFLCIFMLQMTTVITKQATAAFDTAQGGKSSLGTILFLTAGMNADKSTTNPKDLLTGEIKLRDGVGNRNPSFTDNIRKPFLEGDKDHDYRNIDHVTKYFHPANFDYIVGFVGGALLLLVMGGAVLNFIRRLLELLLLYLVAPFFVSTIPLDDGAMFARWRELFIAKFFSGFGTIFSMKYYLMLIPSITSSNLVLYDMSLPNALMINNVLRIFMVVGGAWAVFKSQGLILEILAPDAAMSENLAMAMFSGAVMGGAGAAASFAGGNVSGRVSGMMTARAAGKSSQGEKAKGSQGTKNQDEEQAYRG